MIPIFSVDLIVFTVLGYPVSYIEFFGTGLYLWSVWLIARRNRLTWPVGLVSVLLFLVIYYQIRLYSDMLEQVYYLGASLYGWWYWSRTRSAPNAPPAVRYSTGRALLAYGLATAGLAAALGGIMSQIHLWLPAVFPAAAAYPYLDALTTVMSLTAMWLMARQHIESWLYWIIVDGVGVWLYFRQDVKFIALLYVILLGLAVKGWSDWHRAGAGRRTAA